VAGSALFGKKKEKATFMTKGESVHRATLERKIARLPLAAHTGQWSRLKACASTCDDFASAHLFQQHL
jgi:hypothetical protein